MPKRMAVYDANFYSGLAPTSRLSADLVVPRIVQALEPKSVVDIGCGAGHWVKSFADAGVASAHGVDGPWANSSSVLVPGTNFFEFDFSRSGVPYELELPLGKYDLVTSFEFVEHIDSSRAESLVELFCSLSDTVVLGGAIPHQSGVNHVNEQWPDYWSSLFAARGYVCCDFIRPQVWDEIDVQPWYSQNTLAYFKQSAPQHVQDLAREAWGKFAVMPPNLVQPRIWEHAHPPKTVRRATFELARAIKRALLG